MEMNEVINGTDLEIYQMGMETFIYNDMRKFADDKLSKEEVLGRSSISSKFIDYNNSLVELLDCLSDSTVEAYLNSASKVIGSKKRVREMWDILWMDKLC